MHKKYCNARQLRVTGQFLQKQCKINMTVGKQIDQTNPPINFILFKVHYTRKNLHSTI